MGFHLFSWVYDMGPFLQDQIAAVHMPAARYFHIPSFFPFFYLFFFFCLFQTLLKSVSLSVVISSALRKSLSPEPGTVGLPAYTHPSHMLNICPLAGGNRAQVATRRKS